jgi:inorganic pyrophosphatase
MARNFHCLIEIPKGSRNKYEWDEELQAIKLDRFLFSSVVYPTDYGFIPHTIGEDGDPLDAMVCVSEPTFPGCVIPVKIIALFRMRDDKGVDDKVVCVPEHDPNWNHIDKLEDLGEPLRDEISHFFSIYKQPEGIAVKVDGWFPREQAIEVIEEAQERYRTDGRDPDEGESVDAGQQPVGSGGAQSELGRDEGDDEDGSDEDDGPEASGEERPEDQNGSEDDEDS